MKRIFNAMVLDSTSDMYVEGEYMEDIMGLKSIFEARQQSYGSATLSLVTVEQDNRTLMLVGSLQFNRKVESQGEESPILLDYNGFSLIKRRISVEDAWRFVEQIVNGNLPEGYSFEAFRSGLKEPSWSRTKGVVPNPVGSQRFSLWPSYQFAIYNKNPNAVIPIGPILGRDLPLVIDPKITVSEWVGYDYNQMQQNTLLVSLPDYRARVENIVIGDNEINVNVEYGSVKSSETIAKAALDTVEAEVSLIDNPYSIQIEKTPDQFHFFLLDSETQKIIDWAQVYLTWSDLPPEVRFSSSERRIEQLIGAGEYEQLEFKQEVADGGFLLIQSVVAFANHLGGTILLGVTDNASVVGIQPEKERPKIEEWIENKCDPPVDVRFETISIGGKDILAIHVPQGVNPPYQHRDNGVFYIRRRGTDRPMKRSEWDYLRNAQSRQWPGSK